MRQLLGLIGIALRSVRFGATRHKFHQTVFSSQRVSEEKARIYFLRESNSFACVRSAPLKIDGVRVGKLKNGGFFVVDIAPGEHEISTSIWDVRGRFTLTNNFEPGKHYYVQASIRQRAPKIPFFLLGGVLGGIAETVLSDDKGMFHLVLLEETEAMRKLPDLKLSE